MNVKHNSQIKPTTILTNKSINFEDQGLVFYFEIKILQMDSKKRNIIIGFCSSD